MEKRFQGKKLNKDDHKGMKKAAGGAKIGLAAAGVAVTVIAAAKKHGKEISGFIKSILLRK